MDNVQDEAQLVLQHKKDQFRVEIRKKKTDSLIQQKRLKLFNRNQCGSEGPSDAESKGDQYNNQDQQNGNSNQNMAQKVSTLDVQVLRDLEEKIKQSLKENKIEQLRQLFNQLAKIIGVNPCPLDQVFSTEIPKIVLSIVKKSGPISDFQCKLNAGHVLANLTSGSPAQLNELFQLELLPILIESIQSQDVEQADHIIWAFNNVLTDNHQPQNLARIFQARPAIIEDLCYYFKTSCNNPAIQYQLISSVILSIYFLSRIHKTTQSYYNFLRISVPYLAKLLDTHHPKEPYTINNPNHPMYQNKNDSITFNNGQNFNNNTNSDSNNNQQQVKQKFLSSSDLKICAIIIADLSEGDPRVINDMIRIQVDRIMLRYLEQGVDVSESFLTLVIRTLANLSYGNEFQTDQLLQRDIYSYLNRLIDHPTEQIRKDVCWLISNLSAGNQGQIDVFLDKQMYQTLTHRLNIEQSINVKKEIIFALCNATAQATKEQINTLVLKGLLRVLSDHLDPQFSTELITEILEGIENIMERGRSEDMNNNQNAYKNEFEGSGCQKKIQDLYFSHSNNDVTEICNRILQFWGNL